MSTYRNYKQTDIKFTNKAISLANESFQKSTFPAGALIAKDNKIISKSTSFAFPKFNHHPESASIDAAMDKLNKELKDCILYTSIEPCLMCLCKAYWAGIRKIYFAIKKESVSCKYYESNVNNYDILKKFNKRIKLIHVKSLEHRALEIIKKWEKKNS